MPRLIPITTLVLLAIAAPAIQSQARATPPTRDPHTPGFAAATELADGANAPADADGNFILGPTHTPAPESLPQSASPRGTVADFTLSSSDSRLYPGIAQTPNATFTSDPSDPARLIVSSSRPAPYTRKVTVYVPKHHSR